EAAAINQQFTALIALTSQPDRLNDVAYQVTTLLQELEDILPGLPTTRDDQPVNAPTADEGSTPLAAGVPAADWANVATGINQSIEAALTRY
ncbi:iron permease, partial [Klebsiella pneumoniae]|nr:iron permease [Klebsiella pneumoniae]